MVHAVRLRRVSTRVLVSSIANLYRNGEVSHYAGTLPWKTF